MAYYMVHKRNPYFKQGAIIELFEDGFQECEMVTENHRMRCVGNTGVMVPELPVLPFCIKMLRKGFDDPKLRRKNARFVDLDRDFDLEEVMHDAQSSRH